MGPSTAKRAKTRPRRDQEGDKKGQEGQDGAKMGWGSGDTPKNLEKCAPGRNRFGPRWAKMGPKMNPKLVQEEPKIGSIFGLILGTILGSILGRF